MTLTVPMWRPSFPRVLALAVTVVAAPLPALAGDASPPGHASPGIAAAVHKIAATEPLASSAGPQAAASQQSSPTTTDLGSKSFFKTPAGIVTLVGVGLAFGFTLYATSHDRVSSPKVPFEGGLR